MQLLILTFVLGLPLLILYGVYCWQKNNQSYSKKKFLIQRGTIRSPLKISIQGSCASGKSTIGKALSTQYALPFIDADDNRFYPAHEKNWAIRPRNEYCKIVGDKVKLEVNGWVFDGRIVTLPEVACETSLMIWLDYSFVLIMCRLLKRCVLRIIWKTKCCNGNVETLYNQLTSGKDSLFVFEFKNFWNYKTNERRIIDMIQRNPHMSVLRFSSPFEADEYLKNNNLVSVLENHKIE